MARRNCPGQDTRFWTPDHIYDHPCAQCGAPVEFFRDDLRRVCPHCGAHTVNPKNDLACAAWCAHAAECLAQMGRALPADGTSPAA
jgi:NADH pyrophosphatase NudC (nudix superfamily)